jgi:hypothetical protein
MAGSKMPAPLARAAQRAVPRNDSAAAAAAIKAPTGSVVGIELTAPLAGVAQRSVAANGAAGAVSIVQADAGSCRRGQQIPPEGADVIVMDVFDSGEQRKVVLFVGGLCRRRETAGHMWLTYCDGHGCKQATDRRSCTNH